MASASPAVGLIDTDILIDAERGHPDVIAFVTAQQAASGVRVSAVSAMELIVGSRNTFELTQVRRFLQSVLVIPLDPVISQTALSLVETRFLSHGLLIPDAVIAASALAHGEEGRLPRPRRENLLVEVLGGEG